MHIIDTVLLLGGVVLLAAGALWVRMERGWLTAPLVAMAVGVAAGPEVLDLVRPMAWPRAERILEEVFRLTLAVSMMAIAVHLPAQYPRWRWRSLGVLLLGGMIAMWGATSAVLALVGGMGLTAALLLGAVLTPTDPVLAGTVVTGKIAEENLPRRLRNLLYAESGANDGLALALVMLPVLLLTEPTAGGAWGEWAAWVLAWEVGGGIVLGAAAGYGAGRLQLASERRKLSDERGMLGVMLALTAAVLGGLELLGMNAILGVFAAGLGFHWVARDAIEREQEHFQDTVQRAFQLPAFVLLGAVLPWQAWGELGWNAAAVVALVLAVRRLPGVLALKPAIPAATRWRDAAFMGWFGPMGISALFYALYAAGQVDARTALDAPPRGVLGSELWAWTTLVVTASIVVHGVTATPLTRALGRASGRRRGDAAARPPGA